MFGRVEVARAVAEIRHGLDVLLGADLSGLARDELLQLVLACADTAVLLHARRLVPGPSRAATTIASSTGGAGPVG